MIPGVPYDAEIEYLESTGTQWIDTEVNGSSDLICDALWSYASASAWAAPFGARTNSSTNAYAVTGWGSTADRNIYVNFGSKSSYLYHVGLDIYQYSWKLHLENGNSTLWRNDTAIATSSTIVPSFITAGSIIVSGLREGDSILTGAGVRIHYFKLGNVRDFIPVRVGQTGYMYDRVSKRLFGNQGTGSFVLGPDVAKPVIGLYGMKQITYVPSDYVTDGIVAWYDGEWNAGWNKHDANAQTWKDLSGEGNDATIVKRDTFDRAFTFDSNSCTMDGTFCWRFTASNSVINAVKGDCTIEIIRRLGTPSLQDSTPFFGLNVYNSRAMSMAGMAATCKFRMGMNNEFHVNNSTTPGISNTITKHIDGTTISLIGYEKGIQNAAETWTPQTITVNSNGVLFGAGTNLFGGRGRYWEPSPPADGHAYTLRFYNRALSADEIAHNYAIDKARFNLP